ncbi:MAG: OmpP1/FadL family transporter [Gammaproteobacteria bacterium]
MRILQSSLLMSSLCALSLSQSAFPAAFQFYELGTPVIGTAAVGQAAEASDASTAYFNPAGMGQLHNSQFMLGSQVILPYANFSKSTRTTITGDSGGSAGTLTPGMALYYVYSYSSKLKLGISFTSPYGGLLNYNDGWAGRFFVQNIQLYTLNLNPAIAYQINNCIALGAGFSIEYANLQETIALPLTRLVDGQINLKVDNFAPGFNLGLMLTPTKTTKIGIAYRSKINHNLTGNITFLRIGVTPNASTRLVMPNNVILSLSQEVTNCFTLLSELGWANWATMKNTVVHVAGFSAMIPNDWNNTYRVGLGSQFKMTPALLIQAGVSYDSSPTNSSHRLPDLPMDRQIRAGAGLVYTVIKPVKLGFSYEYINFGNANINNSSANGLLVGSYSRNYANVVQASVNVDC